jgi:sugar phosphate permease
LTVEIKLVAIFSPGMRPCAAAQTAEGFHLASRPTRIQNWTKLPRRMITAISPAEIEKRTMDKVARRLVPFLMLCYFIAYLDRVNISFAGGPMSKDLNLTQAAFGGAAGIFFIAYFIFEVPSNLALYRFGARLWIARIMLTWRIG